MAQTSRATLKTYFITGKYPSQGQFAAFIDTFFSTLEDTLGIADIEGLQQALAAKGSVTIVNQALAIAQQALAAVIRQTVTFNNQQVFNFTAEALANYSSPANFLFWGVMDELPGYNEADKSTWTYKAIQVMPQFTVDAEGNVLNYTIDLGYMPIHGMYQIQ